ncbi:hypothetical protein Q8814_09390 [Rhodococcus sp. CC-R104]|uniref:Transposase n=1 Tax=Rhodococcus chondri TaxID=3065941 RepID=A0ABU7JRE8_9NOCA|nr:hypothetical protein [Rhodococcus sp. CC-R104]
MEIFVGYLDERTHAVDRNTSVNPEHLYIPPSERRERVESETMDVRLDAFPERVLERKCPRKSEFRPEALPVPAVFVCKCSVTDQSGHRERGIPIDEVSDGSTRTPMTPSCDSIEALDTLHLGLTEVCTDDKVHFGEAYPEPALLVA